MSFQQTALANNGATSPGTTAVVSFSGAKAGYACVVCVSYNSTTPTVSTPSGWTLLAGPTDQGSGNRMYLFGKVLTSGDITAGSQTFTASTNTRLLAAASFISNPTGSPFGTPTSTSLSSTCASVTTANVGSVVVYFADDTIASGTPSTATLTLATIDAQAKTANASSTNTALAVAHRNATATGAYGGGTFGGHDATYQTYAVEVAQGSAAAMSAGPDQMGLEPGATVTLDSSASTGVTGSRTWAQTAGATVTLSITSATSPTFTAPPTLTGDTLTFTVTDNASSAVDTVNIGVLASSRHVIIGGTAVPTWRRIMLG